MDLLDKQHKSNLRNQSLLKMKKNDDQLVYEEAEKRILEFYYQTDIMLTLSSKLRKIKSLSIWKDL